MILSVIASNTWADQGQNLSRQLQKHAKSQSVLFLFVIYIMHFAIDHW